MWNCNNPYADRNETLKRLGFDSYAAYLRSDMWRDIKARAIRRAGHKCERCGDNERLQVHHRSYDLKTLCGSDINALTVTCRRCHYRAEQPRRQRPGAERLANSSAWLMTTRPGANEICEQWWFKYGHIFAPTSSTPLAALTAVVARCSDTSRCAICRRKGCFSPGHEPVTLRFGAMVCGRHNGWRLRGLSVAVRLFQVLLHKGLTGPTPMPQPVVDSASVGGNPMQAPTA